MTTNMAAAMREDWRACLTMLRERLRLMEAREAEVRQPTPRQRAASRQAIEALSARLDAQR